MKREKEDLRVSIGSDIINDRMTVEMHVGGRILLYGSIENEKSVSFHVGENHYEFSFADMRAGLLDFISKMETTENY